MDTLVFAVLAIIVIHTYPKARKARIDTFRKKLLLRSIVFTACVSFWVAITMAVGFSVEQIEEGKAIIGTAMLLLLFLFCAPLVLYMHIISIFMKFSVFDSQMKKLMLID